MRLNVLAQAQAIFFGHLHEVLSSLLQQTAVGGVRDRLRHDGRGDDDAVHVGGLHDATAPGGLEGRHEQRLHAVFSNALPPTREAARIDERFGLEVHLAAEVLPIRVLDPGVDHGFVGGVEGVLQVEQSGIQPGRQGRAASSRGEGLAKGALDLGPVDHASQAHQRMAHIDQLVEPRDEQLFGLWRYGLGSHRSNLVRICKETAFCNDLPCKSCARESRKSQTRSTPCRLFRADYLKPTSLVGLRVRRRVDESQITSDFNVLFIAGLSTSDHRIRNLQRCLFGRLDAVMEIG